MWISSEYDVGLEAPPIMNPLERFIINQQLLVELLRGQNFLCGYLG